MAKAKSAFPGKKGVKPADKKAAQAACKGGKSLHIAGNDELGRLAVSCFFKRLKALELKYDAASE